MALNKALLRFKTEPDDDPSLTKKKKSFRPFQSTPLNETQSVSRSLILCCQHEEELKRLKSESERRTNHLLRKHTDEMTIVCNENTRLVETEKYYVNEINALKETLKKYEEYVMGIYSAGLSQAASISTAESVNQNKRTRETSQSYSLESSSSKPKRLRTDENFDDNFGSDDFSDITEIDNNDNDDTEELFDEDITDDANNNNEASNATATNSLKRTQNKMEYCFSLNSIGPIDKKIWLSLKSIGPNCRLIRKQMNSQQRDECKRLIEYSGRLIINEFKHKTTLSGVRRTNSGYSIYRFCSKHSFCYSNWIVNIDINRQEAIVSCNRICEHLTSNEVKEKSKTFKLNSNEVFSVDIWDSIQTTKSSYILRKELGNEQKTETNIVIEYSDGLINKELGYKTLFAYLIKTSNGYRVYRFCNSKQNSENCDLRCIVHIDIFKRESSITFNRKF